MHLRYEVIYCLHSARESCVLDEAFILSSNREEEEEYHHDQVGKSRALVCRQLYQLLCWILTQPARHEKFDLARTDLALKRTADHPGIQTLTYSVCTARFNNLLASKEKRSSSKIRIDQIKSHQVGHLGHKTSRLVSPCRQVPPPKPSLAPRNPRYKTSIPHLTSSPFFSSPSSSSVGICLLKHIHGAPPVLSQTNTVAAEGYPVLSSTHTHLPRDVVDLRPFPGPQSQVFMRSARSFLFNRGLLWQ